MGWWPFFILQGIALAIVLWVGYWLGRSDGYLEGHRKGFNECRESNNYTGYGDYLMRNMARSIARSRENR